MKLQIAVQEKAHALRTRGDDDALIRTRLAVQDMVRIKAVLGPGGDVVGARERGGECSNRQCACERVRAELPQLTPKQPKRPDGDASVQQPEESTGADQAELRHEQQREG